MTIKDVAQRTNLTHQAIYKRLKSKGIKLNDIKDSKTGQFTDEGEQIVLDLFNLSETAEQASEASKTASDDELHNCVNELTTENEKLRNQVEMLTSERDFLRQSLEREQQLQAMTLTKLLPSGDQNERGRFRAAWDALRGRR